jgi:PAS domain S-box-containing protein
MQVQEPTGEQFKQELRELELQELRVRNAALELLQAESAQVRKALQETEARYRALVEQCPDAILVTSDDKCIYVNPAGVRLFGAASPSELWIKNILDLIHPEHRSAFAERMSRLLEHGGPNPLLEESIVRLDGREVLVEAIATRIDYQGGPAIQFLLRDITYRKQAEAATKRLAAVVESSDDAIITKTLDGTILSWNAGAERIYGYSAAEVLGRPVSLLVPPDRIDELPHILARIAKGERIAHYQTQRVTNSGRRIHISLAISPLIDPDGKIIGASTIARDITNQRQEEESRKAKAAVDTRDSWP